jgi:hypothetical protein
MIKTRKKNHKKNAKKTLKKNRIGGSKTLACSISVPMQSIDGKNQVLQGSINVNHFDNFLNCLINSKGGSHWKKIIDNFNNIRKFQKKGTFLMYYTSDILDDIKIPRIQAKLILLYKMKKFIDEEKRIYDLNQKNQVSRLSLESTHKNPILAGGSGLESYASEIIGVGMFLLSALVWNFKDSLCQKQISNVPEDTVASIISNHAANKKKAKIEYEDEENGITFKTLSSDYRRKVILVDLEDGKQCVLKISKNPNYIPLYLIETRVYDQLMAQAKSMGKKLDVLEYYGKSEDKKKRAKRTYLQKGKNININFKIGKKMYDIEMPVWETGTYFYFAMEYTEKFKTLETALYSKNVSRIKRDRAIQGVCDSIGELNRDYGFFHGDLKIDNVFVDITDYRSIKNMDFDFSGLIGAEDNVRMAATYFASEQNQQKVENYILTKNYHAVKKVDQAKNFLYFFDIYRLWCSLPSSWDGGITGKYDTFSTNEIIATNGSIKFKLGDFVKFFTSNGGGVKEMKYLDQIDKKNRKLPIIMQNIKKHYHLQSDDWNITLMHEDIVFKMFEYVSNPIKKGSKKTQKKERYSSSEEEEEEEDDSSSHVRRSTRRSRNSSVNYNKKTKKKVRYSSSEKEEEEEEDSSSSEEIDFGKSSDDYDDDTGSTKVSARSRKNKSRKSTRSGSKPWPGQTKAGKNCKKCIGLDQGNFCHLH